MALTVGGDGFHHSIFLLVTSNSKGGRVLAALQGLEAWTIKGLARHLQSTTESHSALTSLLGVQEGAGRRAAVQALGFSPSQAAICRQGTGLRVSLSCSLLEIAGSPHPHQCSLSQPALNADACSQHLTKKASNLPQTPADDVYLWGTATPPPRPLPCIKAECG